MRLFWQLKRTLRFRLTAWYVFLLGCTLIIFSSYLYLQLKYNLLIQLDTTLEITASEVLSNLVIEKDHLSFNHRQQFEASQQQLANAGLIVKIIDLNHNTVDGFGNYQLIKSFVSEKRGYQNLTLEGVRWRVYSIPLKRVNSQIIEARFKFERDIQLWLQVAQSLQPINKALEHLLTIILFAVPLILLFAALGGLLWADRALSPINSIIRTASAINPDDLSYRINYQGASDEVGRLAITLDRMLDRIESAFEHERRFIADASHELRTPLTVIKGRIGVALSRLRTPREYQTTLQDLDVQVDRLIRMTNGLLFLTRLEQEQLQGQGNFWRVDFSNLLEILAEQIEPLAQDKQLDFKSEIAPDLYILGDGDLLTSLFLNLLDNAIKYTDNGGKVRLVAKCEGQNLSIVISNSGKGIAAENLPYLFDRFYRLEADRNKNITGNGLGLAIAALIARCHSGQISVDSQINQLTTFKVSFPCLK
ncbi:integral membrane sensor signal transduction histidine kinase [Chondrocystis sp. NIES-4102]|nr:integral membrane sensor signal transduction histidine kinase [Chondrocystis sp. NIES-4102]